MKKTVLFLAALLCVLMLLPVSAGASAELIKPNAPITMPCTTPVIDGTISTDEGWSAIAYLNEDTAGYFWAHQAMTSSADVYFAYNDDGIFFAADITERDYLEHPDQNGAPAVYKGNGFVASSDLDDIDVNAADGSRNYGWNGDVFAFMFDPLGKFAEEGFNANEDYTAWYDVGLFTDGTARMYRSKVNEGEITSEVKLAAVTTDAGWRLEAFIPWNIIIADADAISSGEIKLTKEELAASGATSRAAVMYMDRFYDSEATMNDTWGRYITVAETTTAGIAGNMSSGDHVGGYGLSLVNADRSAQPAAPGDTQTTTAAPGGNVTTKAPAANTNNGGSAAAAQTFDAGIAVACGSAVVAALGFGFSRRKRTK